MLINLLFALVIILAVGGGVAVIGIHYVRQFPSIHSIDQFDQVQVALDHAGVAPTQEDILNAQRIVRQYGFYLLWYDGDDTVKLGEDEIDNPHEKTIIENTAQSGKIVSRYGLTVIQKDLLEGKLIAVDDANYSIPMLERELIILMGVMSGLLMLVAVFGAIIDNAIIMPRVRKARDGLQQLYRGNYEVELQSNGKRKDDIGLLMTDIEAVRRKLSDLTKQREAFDREQGVMISGISHDMRTPLTIIKTHAKGLIDGVAQKRDKAEEYYERIYQTANDMTGLVERLSSFGKGQNREVMYSFAERDLTEVLKEFVKNNYYPYVARGLEIKLQLPQHKVWVSLDKEQANRIWQNIADNALKYKTAKVGHLMISLAVKGDWAIIKLADDGPGIKNFEAEYIFESYYRGDPSRTNPISGSGLGLAIVRSVVAAHHGDVRAYNDHGLTIEIKLPVRRKK